MKDNDSSKGTLLILEGNARLGMNCVPCCYDKTTNRNNLKNYYYGHTVLVGSTYHYGKIESSSD